MVARSETKLQVPAVSDTHWRRKPREFRGEAGAAENPYYKEGKLRRQYRIRATVWEATPGPWLEALARAGGDPEEHVTCDLRDKKGGLVQLLNEGGHLATDTHRNLVPTGIPAEP